jgi:hypothetical protein
MPRHERLRVVSGHLEANLTAVAHRTLEDLASCTHRARERFLDHPRLNHEHRVIAAGFC